MRVLGSTREREFLVREGAVPAGGNEQPANAGQSLGPLASATTYVHSSPAWLARATSSIALLWSRKLETPGLKNVLSIRAFFLSRNALGIEESPEIVAAARHRTKSEPEDSSLLNVVHQLRGRAGATLASISIRRSPSAS